VPVSEIVKADPNSVTPDRKLLFLDLPYELRRRVYEVLICTSRTVALNYLTPSERRIGILEPLRLSCKVLYAQVTQWGLVHRDLTIRSPMWGLYNPHLTRVCMHFLDSSIKSAYIFIGSPLTSEDVDKIAIWWRCMKNARSDYFREVNRAIRWNKLVE
jgi:hypothetical protein